jgi:hypothetical protein
MTDVERRLRAAMAASAEPAPAGLLEGIRRRHRRRHRRLAVACAAVVALGAGGTLVSRGVLGGPAGPGRAGPGPAATGPVAGMVLRNCQSNNNGTLGSGWKALSVHAGPVWFIYERPRGAPPSGHPRSAGKVAGSAMVIAIDNGHTAVVSAAPQIRGRFRFLAAFNADGRPYTLAEGAPGLTLSGCPRAPAGTRIPETYAPGLTMFWEGYVTDLRGCIPLEVRSRPASPPIRVTVAAPAAAAPGC